MIIGIDIDDTIEDLLPIWLEALNAISGKTIKARDVKEWGLEKIYPNLSLEQLYKPLESDFFWQQVKPKKNAAKVLQQLIKDGHEVYLITASHYTTIFPKVENMLKKYFPFIDWKHVIITANKQLIKCDLLIDDCPANLVGASGIKLLMNTSYNESFEEWKEDKMFRVYNWKEIYTYIAKPEKK